MKQYLNATLYILLVGAVIFLSIDFLFFKDDARAALAILTPGGLIALVLYAASHSAELRKSK